MRVTSFLFCAVVCGVAWGQSSAQRMMEREESFLSSPPHVGDRLPSLMVFATDGTPVSTDALRGHYTVLTFGCLT